MQQRYAHSLPGRIGSSLDGITRVADLNQMAAVIPAASGLTDSGYFGVSAEDCGTRLSKSRARQARLLHRTAKLETLIRLRGEEERIRVEIGEIGGSNNHR